MEIPGTESALQAENGTEAPDKIASPEEAIANFERAWSMFQQLCKVSESGFAKDLLKLKKERAQSFVEGAFHDPDADSGPRVLRVRMSIPFIDSGDCDVPSITTGGDLNASSRNIFDRFISKFKEAGIIVRHA